VLQRAQTPGPADTAVGAVQMQPDVGSAVKYSAESQDRQVEPEQSWQAGWMVEQLSQDVPVGLTPNPATQDVQVAVLEQVRQLASIVLEHATQVPVPSIT
jgi:hypothetical protein